MILALVLAISTTAAADLVREVEQSKASIEKTEVRQREVLSALYDLNKKIRKTVSEQASLRAERQGLEDSVRRLQERLADLDASSRGLRAKLSERLRAIHRLGGPSLARVLSSASSASDLDRNLKILGIVAERDRNLFREYRMLRSETKSKHEKLAGRLEKLKDVETSLKDREQRLVAEQNVKNKILSGIRRKRLFAEQSLEELRRKTMDAKVDDAVLDLLFKPSFADQRGLLDAPVAGPIVRKFGPERSDDGAWTLTHKGIRFAVAGGTAVKAVFDGTVAWIGEIAGFGRTLVVDHGDHYYSVYGNAARVHVNTGDEVRRDQILASVGDRRLYFEIRHFSEPYDPQLWLKGSAL